MTRLLIARHGNTFDKGDTILRVGLKTDLDLSESGKAQSIALGELIKKNNIQLDKIYTSELKRTIQTAKLISDLEIEQLTIFNEIDYGIDDGKPESCVVSRIGQAALTAWEIDAIVPPGWQVNPQQIIKAWQDFAEHILEKYNNQTVLVVTSNGIARFAPFILNNFEEFKKNNTLKMPTASLSSFSFNNEEWQLDFWGEKNA